MSFCFLAQNAKNELNNELNPLRPNVIIHILHTVLYTYPKVLTINICLLIKSFFCCASFP